MKHAIDKIFLLSFIVIFGFFDIIGVGKPLLSGLQTLYVSIREEIIPPHLFNIEDPNITYIIMIDKETGIYSIYPSVPSFADKEHPAYISAAPTPLDLFVNRLVKIEGKFVWTKQVLRNSSHPQEEWLGKTAAVAIEKISLAQ